MVIANFLSFFFLKKIISLIGWIFLLFGCNFFQLELVPFNIFSLQSGRFFFDDDQVHTRFIMSEIINFNDERFYGHFFQSFVFTKYHRRWFKGVKKAPSYRTETVNMCFFLQDECVYIVRYEIYHFQRVGINRMKYVYVKSSWRVFLCFYFIFLKIEPRYELRIICEFSALIDSSPMSIAARRH